MAGRRAALKAIDWVAFAERVPPNQRTLFNNLKTRSDAISAKLSSLPEKPAVIDWSYYRSAVAKAGMVDEFEQKFTALKVPEPVDTQTVLINTQEAEAASNVLALGGILSLCETPEGLYGLENVTRASIDIVNTSAAAYIEASKARITQYETELDKFKNMIPFDQMTIEDLNETFPETQLDKVKHPYWPHKPIAEL